jgi:hypothetical protein
VQRHLKPGEMVDVRVREVLIELVDGSDLLIGLPVEVFIERGPAEAESANRPDRYSPLRPTPQPVAPQLGQNARRLPGRASSFDSSPTAGDRQPAVKRAAAFGEWQEPKTRE